MLTEQEKQKIKDEEEYRASVRNTPISHKKPTGCLSIIVSLFGIGLVISIVTSAISPKINKSDITTNVSTSTEYKRLSANVLVTDTYIEITNNETRDWFGCVYDVNNSSYKNPGSQVDVLYGIWPGVNLKAGQTIKIPTNEFLSKSSVKLNTHIVKITSVGIYCPDEGEVDVKINY